MNLSHADFDYIRKLLHQRTGVALDSSKEYLVKTRLGPLLDAEGIGSLAGLVRRLQSGKQKSTLWEGVIDAMMTGESSFFRDVKPFENLKSQILPELLQKRCSERRLNIWCGACSSGQEPYSIAMLLHEHFPQLVGWQLQIVATDISIQVLERARLGCFNHMEVARGLPAALLIRYFNKAGLVWQVREEIRDMIRFEQLNLFDDWSWLGQMDIVFLRNVLIYFDVEGKKKILRKMHHILKPGGYLFLGSAETTAHLDDAYETVLIGNSACYRLRPC